MPELRRDPVVGRWVIISKERSKRPKDLIVEVSEDNRSGQHDCDFCQNRQDYKEIVSIRDLNAKDKFYVMATPRKNHLLRIEGDVNRRGKGLYDVMEGIGAHELVIETPEHILNMADLALEQIDKVFSVFTMRIKELSQDERLKYVMIYKNYTPDLSKNTILHSRSNIMAMPVNPKRVKEKLIGAKAYYDYHERCVFCDIIRQEREMQVRVADENDDFIALSAFAGRFPFEMLILPKEHNADFHLCPPEKFRSLSAILKSVLQRLKLGLNDPAYSMVLFSAPFRRGHLRKPTSTLDLDFHWHIEIMPQLTRTAGFEWGSGFYINPMPPEDAAKFLKNIEVKL